MVRGHLNPILPNVVGCHLGLAKAKKNKNVLMEPKCVITINVNPKFWLFGLKGRYIQICKVGRGGVGNLVKVQYMGRMILKVMLPSLLLGT
jgi:hypothetical protein